MLLQRAFLRKKRVRIYIIIFTILFTIILLLNSYKKYYEKFSSDFMNNHTILIANTDKNHTNLVEDEEEIKSFQRVIVFDKGIDNDIILTPPHTQNVGIEDGDHSSKLYWESLMYKNQILVFPASFLDKELEDNQVVILTNDFFSKSEYLSNFNNKNLSFNFNNKNISLEINEILEPVSIPFICISDNLYNDLVIEEDNYTFYTELAKYSSLDTIKEKWSNLTENKTISFDSLSFFKEDELGMDKHMQDIINMLSIANTISLIIFYVIIIIVIKDLVSDEQKDILLLKNIGYNKIQNIFNILKNLLILDIIVFLISLVLYTFITIILNNTLNFNLEIFNYNFISFLFISIILVESLFSIIYIKNY